MRLVTIVGARPQFIKAAAVSRIIRARAKSGNPSTIKETLVHTGQHFDDNMSRVFFDELSIPNPDYNLGVQEPTHGRQTGHMVMRLEEVLLEERPDKVLVYGDTNSTLAGALAAVKLHIPVAHVEAGLRSFNRAMPEEINRVLTDHISSLLFCPTETAVRHLTTEGITEGVEQTGDVMCDSALFYRERARAIESRLLSHYGVRPASYHLATVHRAENTDDPERLQAILEALSCISSHDVPTLLPVHPRTAKKLEELRISLSPQVKRLPPLSYLQMIALEANAKVILTDSGGVQKEAYVLRVPCITLRDETEWVETLTAGWNVLAGADTDTIVRAAEETAPENRDHWMPVYGDGAASERICDLLIAC